MTSELSSSKYRFRLWHVFYVTALVAVAFSFSIGLLFVAAFWFAICRTAASSNNRRHRLQNFGGLFLLAAIGSCCMGGVFFPSIGPARDAARRAYCLNNMRQIMFAMLDYENAYKTFPDAAQSIEPDKPPHSWRVALLPYLGYQDLYDEYDFSQPWDSPTNSKLVEKMPPEYRCPCHEDDGTTTYKLVVGPGTLYDGGPTTISRVEDGTSNTIALVEDHANPVKWMQPSDITIDDALAVLRPGSRSDFPHVVDRFDETTYLPGNCARFDGSIEYIGKYAKLVPTEQRKLFGINDGVAKDVFDLDYESPLVVRKVRPFIVLGLFALLMIYPLSWVFRGDESPVERPSEKPPE